MIKRLFPLLLLLVLAACGAESDAPAVQAPVATNTPAPPPTATNPPPTLAPVSDAVSYGQTEEGAFFRGNPDAGLTITDYSDFL